MHVELEDAHSHVSKKRRMTADWADTTEANEQASGSSVAGGIVQILRPDSSQPRHQTPKKKKKKNKKNKKQKKDKKNKNTPKKKEKKNKKNKRTPNHKEKAKEKKNKNRTKRKLAAQRQSTLGFMVRTKLHSTYSDRLLQSSHSGESSLQRNVTHTNPEEDCSPASKIPRTDDALWEWELFGEQVADDVGLEECFFADAQAYDVKSYKHEDGTWDVDSAMVSVSDGLCCLKDANLLLVRIVDHAVSSSACISVRLANIVKESSINVHTDFSDGQPVDSCGYIAAEVVARLRDVALSEGDSWLQWPLPREFVDCIVKGSTILDTVASNGARVLHEGEVNSLVRAFSNLDTNIGAHEEWWGGAVALDCFLQGLHEFLRMRGKQEQHQWRAWVVNTQSSSQQGSHWFTVVVGVKHVAEPATADTMQATRTSAAESASRHSEQPPKKQGSILDYVQLMQPSYNQADNLVRREEDEKYGMNASTAIKVLQQMGTTDSHRLKKELIQVLASRTQGRSRRSRGRARDALDTVAKLYNLPRWVGVGTRKSRVRCRVDRGWLKYECQRVLIQNVRRMLSDEPACVRESSALLMTPRCLNTFADSIRVTCSCFQTPFGSDFETIDWGLSNELDGPSCARHLALAELKKSGFHWTTNTTAPLPYEYHGLICRIVEERKRRQETLTACSRIQSAAELAQILVGWCQEDIQLTWFIQFCIRKCERKHAMTELQPQSVGPGNTTHQHQIAPAAAESIAQRFIDFVVKYELQSNIRAMDQLQILVLALFHAHLSSIPPKRIQSSRRMQYFVPKREYIPAANIRSPWPPFFIKQSNLTLPPQIQAPRVCQLCGDGFVDWNALVNHCDSTHANYAEYRKRVFYEAETLHALHLSHARKRGMLANFAMKQTHSTPGEGCFGSGRACMRQEVACATCALTTWIDHMYPCYLWKELPLDEEVDAAPIRDSESTSSSDGEVEVKRITKAKHVSTPPTTNRLRRDNDGVLYLGGAERIHQLLDVEVYAAAWPLIPKEELHASSIQHPRYPAYRWLLHTKRVPVLSQSAAEQVATDPAGGVDARPRCAGVGDPEAHVYLCSKCREYLCRAEPGMPPYALANWNWGGREHPAFRNLSRGMKMLLGLGRPLFTMTVLRHAEEEENQERGLVGNTILLAHPTPAQVLHALPPSEDEIQQCFSVIFKRFAHSTRPPSE